MEPMDTPHTMLGRFNFAVGEKTLYIAGGAGTGGGIVRIDTSSGKRKSNLNARGASVKAVGKPSPNDQAGAVMIDGGCVVASVSPDGRTGAELGWAPKFISVPRPEPPSGRPVGFLNLNEGTEPRALEFPSGPEPPHGIFSADSRFFILAAGEENRNIYVVNVKNAEVRSSYTVDAPVARLSSLKSGEIAAVGTEPKAIVVWKIKTP